MLARGLLVAGVVMAVSDIDTAHPEGVRVASALGLIAITLANPAPSTQTLLVTAPAILLLGAPLYTNQKWGQLTALLVCVVAIQVHPYTIELLTKFGPNHFPVLRTLTPLTPYLQPAAFGVWGLFGIAMFQWWNTPSPYRSSKSSVRDILKHD